MKLCTLVPQPPSGSSRRQAHTSSRLQRGAGRFGVIGPVLIAAVIAGAMFASHPGTTTPVGTAAVTPGVPTPAGTSPALSALAQLPVATEHPLAGYSRARFPHWLDADRDNCDARGEVLARESRTQPALCVGRGPWLSIYDGVSVTDPRRLDVDHVVPLAEAWRSGAWAWTTESRARFANDLSDPRTLRAVTATANRAKSDADPAHWLPMASARCAYAADWISIKARWQLSVDVAERDALQRILTACPR